MDAYDRGPRGEPAEHDGKPAGPGAGPTGSGMEPVEPGAEPVEAARADARPTGPDARPTGPDTQPPASADESTGTEAVPSGPDVEPTASDEGATTPAAEPPTPPAGPSVPVAQPTASGSTASGPTAPAVESKPSADTTSKRPEAEPTASQPANPARSGHGQSAAAGSAAAGSAQAGPTHPRFAAARPVTPVLTPTPAPTPTPVPQTKAGIAALSRGGQVVAALALAVVVATVCVHVGMLFLHVAPSNTVTKEHGRTVDDWIYPEFEQNWKLFAPNPLQQNVSVQARAKIRTADGTARTTRWHDLSAQDGAAIDHNLLPSHTQQNELRRGWDFFVATHDAQNRPTGLRGELSERYIRRIALLRLDRHEPLARGEAFDQVQVRSRTTPVRPPEWSDEKIDTKPVRRWLPWWSVTPPDLPLADEDRARRDVAAELEGSVR